MLRLIADHADPNSVAVLAPGRPSLTCARLCREIEKHAQIVRAIGVGMEDRLALRLPDEPEGALGLLATSAVFVCARLNPICTANERDTTLSDLKAGVLIAWPDLDGERPALCPRRRQ